MMTIHRRIAFALLAATAILAAAGCDLFETREPETSSGSGSQWERPTSPEIIVDNLEVAFENAIFNDYRRALTEDFTFVPDDSDRFDMDTIERPGEEVYEAAKANLTANAPLRDVATPERCADAILAFIQHHTFSTGQTIVVDGGATL